MRARAEGSLSPPLPLPRVLWGRLDRHWLPPRKDWFAEQLELHGSEFRDRKRRWPHRVAAPGQPQPDG